MAFLLSTALARAGDAADTDFDAVRRILSEKCFACHGPDPKARKADLRLDVRQSALEVLAPGRPDQSELVRRVTATDEDDVMPPPRTKTKITGAEADVLRRWIGAGASYARHWAFVPPRRRPPPAVKDAAWARNAIDAFVLARLEAAGLAPSPTADKRALMRRVTLDLTGLPPTPDDVAAFLDDDSPHAYEKLVDRLLSSPRYGEHMASFWLDASRYADTDGYQNDRYRYMHVWRDWVILTLTESKPFDEFVIEQLAGDLLPGATLRQQIATGFSRNHRINSEAGSIPEEWHVENVVDRVDTLGTVFLGLTIGCARCHEHKYDPISQKEYYRLFAYFNNVPEWGIGPNNGNSPPFIEVPKSWPFVPAAENRLIPPAALGFQKNQYGGGVVRPRPGGPTTVMVMQEQATRRPTHLLKRGQYNTPDKSEGLDPGVPASLEAVGGKTPGNRLELARWLVHPDHPLTARVAINRYWQHLFGTGIVKTSENFGTRGEPPSHPELLDWLATEFVAGGWNVKAIQKLILMSATYRQSSRVSGELVRRDPENRLLGRGPRQRLPAFALRDQALFVAGLLHGRISGPSVKPYMPPKIWKSISNNKYEQDHGDALYRRSLYTYWRRTIPPPTMVNFNAAGREVCVVRKEITNTPLQALTLMNNTTFVEAARFLAERMMREGQGSPDGPGGPDDRLAHGFQLATGRAPRSRERSLLSDAYRVFLERYRDNPMAAKQLLAVGEKPRDPSLDTVQHAALTMVASLIVNLDEVVTKE